MKRLRRIYLFLFALLVILVPALVEADGIGIPVISAPFVTKGVGDTFTIPISIIDAVDLTFWQFDLAFNPAIVRANSVTEGPFMSTFGNTLFGTGVIDNTAGLFSLVTDSYVDPPTNPSGSGVLANIEFHALAPGVSPLTFSNVFLNLSNSGFSIDNGQITVTGTAVPEPTTLALLGSGLALLGMLRLIRQGRRDES
jgi:hypothetical protein